MARIKIYGDSILKGVMYSEEYKKYRLFGYKYDELEKSGISVENNCKMGATIGKGFEIMKATLDDCDENTIVVMEFGGNDCNFNWAQVAVDPGAEHIPATPENEFVEQYASAIDYAKSKGARPVICSLIPIASQKFMDWVSRGLNYANILKYIGRVDTIGDWQSHYSDLAMRAAAETQTEVIDLRRDFTLDGGGADLIGIDGIHPTADGHKKISALFQNELKKKVLST